MARRTWDESDVRIRANKRGSRPRTKQRPTHEDAVIARVVAVDRGRYTCVVGEDEEQPRTVTCVRAKELRRQPIVPGDLVGVVGDVTGAPDTLARILAGKRDEVRERERADDRDDAVPQVRGVRAPREALRRKGQAARSRTGSGLVLRRARHRSDARVREA